MCAKTQIQIDKSILVLLLMTGLCLIPGVNRLSAAQVGAEASGGYDSNASHSSEETGSGFARYRLWATQPFLQENPILQGSAVVQGTYQDFFKVADNYRMSAGADLRWHLSNKRIVPTFMGEAVFYRNREVPEDDVSSVLIGSRLQWLATSRLTLGGYQSFSWLDNATGAAAGTGSGAGPSGPGRSGPHNGRRRDLQDAISVTTADDETGILSQTRMEATFYILPGLTADLSIGHNRMFSRQDAAEYAEYGLIGGVRFEPNENWAFTGQVSYWDTEYDTGGFDEDTRALDLWGSRYIDEWEVFALARWLDKASASTFDTYQQTVIECGVSRTF